MRGLSSKARRIQFLRRLGLFSIVLLFTAIVVVHYRETLRHPAFIRELFTALGLDRHAFERILFLVPVLWSAFLFRWRAGLLVMGISLAAMLPRALMYSEFITDSLFETAMVFIVGVVAVTLLEAVRGERERYAELQAAQRALQSHIMTIEENERRLAALNETSVIVSQSLDLNQVLQAAATNVAGVMQVAVVMIFLLDPDRQRLDLVAYRGVSPEFARKLGWLRVGEGLNGEVARTGSVLLIDDASNDPRLTKHVVVEENLRSMLVVPMSSKGRVLGTLCVAMRSLRAFQPDEVELLSAIGNQIGVAVENATLYLRERQVASQLRASEERYRQLFQNAQDAIWLHDLQGHVIQINTAGTRLTGYTLGDMSDIRAEELFSAESQEIIRHVEAALMEGEETGFPVEVEMVRRDGSRAIAQVTTNLIWDSGRPVAVQHIGRDVTEEKRLQENLRYFSQQALRAQEEERKRIARELHDETLQDLVILSRQLDDLISQDGDDLARTRVPLEELRHRVDSLAHGIRRFSQALRPSVLDHLGLVPAIEATVDALKQNTGIEATMEVTGQHHRLPAEVELVVFRIVQEALSNVARHSKATRVRVLAEFTQTETRVTVSDNGVGFSPPHGMGDLARDGKLGLAGMEERARLVGGQLTLESEPGKGTTITVSVPV